MLREGADVVVLAGGGEGDPSGASHHRRSGGGGDVARVEFRPCHFDNIVDTAGKVEHCISIVSKY